MRRYSTSMVSKASYMILSVGDQLKNNNTHAGKMIHRVSLFVPGNEIYRQQPHILWTERAIYDK